MTEGLIIVESPAKAKTLKRFLGDRFDVLASMGHVRDLPGKELAVDVDAGFKPHYEVVESRRKTINELRSAVKKDGGGVILASDPDREGEAIAWHLSEVLNLRSPKRIEFHEITADAVRRALESPREIDMRLVNAQQARRVVDRLVGYRLSPFLWAKVQKGIGAGRVSSVALRLVVDREEEIRKFLEGAIAENKVMLFMKGTPDAPRCGFSMRTSGALNTLGIQYAAMDILPDPRIREELSAISDWPTIPQLFVEGKLVGGCDIVMEMFENGELADMLGVEQPELDDEPEIESQPAAQSAPMGLENRLQS